MKEKRWGGLYNEQLGVQVVYTQDWIAVVLRLLLAVREGKLINYNSRGQGGRKLRGGQSQFHSL